jgi:hypothetical protein
MTAPRQQCRFLVGLVSAPLLLLASLGGATAPATRYTFPVLDGISVVMDDKTQLAWQRASSVETTYAWSDAQAYCDALGAGFRLPSMKELQTIVDESTTRPALDTGAFPNGPEAAYYWTSSSFARDDTLAWVVNLGVGNTLAASKISKQWVRCVR